MVRSRSMCRWVATVALGPSALAALVFSGALPAAKAQAGAPENVRRAELADVNLVGKFTVTGKAADGAALAGSFDLTKIKDERYKGTGQFNGKKVFVTAARDGDILNATWSEKQFVGQTVYKVGCDFTMEGLSYGADRPGAAEELLKGGNSSLLGTYTVLGQDTDHSWYGGTLDFAAGSGGVFLVTYKGPSETHKGIGLRLGEEVVTCTRSDKLEFTLAQLRITSAGAKLTGKMATRAQSPAGAGTVTWTK